LDAGGRTEVAAGLGYAPLPPPVIALEKEALKKIKLSKGKRHET